MKITKHNLNLLLILLVFQLNSYCQNTEGAFVKDTKVSVKFGTTVNGINSAIYKQINDGYSSQIYSTTSDSYFVNPYASIGIENHFLKHLAIQFNVGFNQTRQKYSSNNLYLVNNNSGLSVASSNVGYSKNGISKYINNNVFLEILPTYIYKHTRFMGGLNLTHSSPNINTKVTVTDYNTNMISTETFKDKPTDSYHVYTMFGVMQGVTIKSHEMTISATYFGLLKKYDSGLNIALGFTF